MLHTAWTGDCAPDIPDDPLSLALSNVLTLRALVFAPTEHGIYYAKQQWLVPKTHNFVPRHGVETAHPLLILTTTYDPVCPLISAQSARAAFKGSQIVEVEGYGHCSMAVPSICLVRHVRAYLQNGTVPKSQTKCSVDGGYFPEPAGTVRGSADGSLEDDEDQKIHAAQVALARHWMWY